MSDEKNTDKVILVLGFVIFISWGVSGVVLHDIKDRGTFGDMFGAVNSLFSGFAFLGVIYAVFLQRVELKLQREELRLTRSEMSRQADAQEEQSNLADSSHRLQLANICLEILENRLDSSDKSDKEITKSYSKKKDVLETEVLNILDTTILGIGSAYEVNESITGLRSDEVEISNYIEVIKEKKGRLLSYHSELEKRLMKQFDPSLGSPTMKVVDELEGLIKDLEPGIKKATEDYENMSELLEMNSEIRKVLIAERKFLRNIRSISEL